MELWSRAGGRRIQNFSRSRVLKWLTARPFRIPKDLFILHQNIPENTESRLLNIKVNNCGN